MKKYLLILFLLMMKQLSAQEKVESVMTLSEYLGYVKAYHPIVKQANLVINESEAKLLKARGAFDPKIEVDFDKKQFKEKEYYNKQAQYNQWNNHCNISTYNRKSKAT